MRHLESHVSNLIEGEVYLFRVSASNAQGESEPLECFAPVTTESERRRPDKLSGLKVREEERGSVTLEWSPPPDGAEIIKFIVEKQEQFQVPKMVDEETTNVGDESEPFKMPPQRMSALFQRGISFTGEFEDYSSSWMFATEVDGDEHNVKIEDLSDNHRYRFRVKAVNARGCGPPSDPSSEILCKAKARPIIDRNTTKKVFVSRGDPAVILVKFSGDPIPDRSWYLGTTKLQSSSSILIEDKDHSSKLTLLGLGTGGSKQFQFQVQNEYGQESVLVDLVVKEPPFKPKGPLKIDDITANGCLCQWKEPEYDGGSPILHYLIEYSQVMPIQVWKLAGKATETTFKVSDLNEGKAFNIRVKAVNEEGESEPLMGVDSFVAENPFGVPSAPGVPSLSLLESDALRASWDPPRHNGGATVTGYEVETREAKDHGFSLLNKVNGNLSQCEVSPVHVGQRLLVRVRAVNEAGAGAWSIESYPILVQPKTLVPKVAWTDFENVAQVELNIHESFEVKATIEADPPADEVLFTLDQQPLALKVPEAETIIKSLSAEVRIKSVPRKLNGCLTCIVRNRHGEDRASLRIIVQAPPTSPDLVEVTEVSKTTCRLQWQASVDDGGLPISYVIEKQDCQSPETWTKIGHTSGTTFQAVGLLTGNEYGFQIKAVNSVGESEAASLLKTVVAKDKNSKLLLVK